jgi:hypothetical protein
VTTYTDAPIRLLDDDGGALIIRRARKDHRCHGNGAAHTAFALDCRGRIVLGECYLEVLWSAPAYASGQRVCSACALAFFGDWVEGTQ